MWRGGSNGEPELLEKCFSDSLKLAEELNCKSIAFPPIGTKSGRIPKKEAIRIALRVFEQYPTEKLDIKLVLYDLKTVETAKALYPDLEISEVVDMGAIWEPEEHNLYCEKKNILKYRSIKKLEETVRTFGDNGKRTEAASVNLPYIRAREEHGREWEDIGVHHEEGFYKQDIDAVMALALEFILMTLVMLYIHISEPQKKDLFLKLFVIIICCSSFKLA